MAGTSVPYTLTRLGVVMSPEPGNERESEGVLNPASGYGADGELYLLPRLVARGNVSRVGLAKVLFEDGVPVGVERRGVVLAPDEGWERGHAHGGVEDPRTTWVPRLRSHLMTYVAYGPLGPRLALAVSVNLTTWRRLGPVQFGYQPGLDTDLNLFPNKDAVFFPEPVTGPDGRPSYAMLHRPMWNLSWVRPGAGVHVPADITDDRPGIWVSFAPVADVEADIRNLVRMSQHRLVALPEHQWESLKIGAGPPPFRVEDGWLLLHHGVDGELDDGFGLQQGAIYAAGAMLLDAEDVTRVLARSEYPLLQPQTDGERVGTVSNVVFPTATEEIDGVRYVFYGMADARIGVAALERIRP